MTAAQALVMDCTGDAPAFRGLTYENLFKLVCEFVDADEERQDDLRLFLRRKSAEIMADEEKQYLHKTAKNLQETLQRVGSVSAHTGDGTFFFDWLAEHFCSEERPGARIGPDVVNEFIDMVDRAVEDTTPVVDGGPPYDAATATGMYDP